MDVNSSEYPKNKKIKFINKFIKEIIEERKEEKEEIICKELKLWEELLKGFVDVLDAEKFSEIKDNIKKTLLKKLYQAVNRYGTTKDINFFKEYFSQ